MTYRRKRTLFADGAKGFKLQQSAIHVVKEDGGTEETGILENAVKKNSNSGWEVTFVFAGESYATVHQAIAAYEAAQQEKEKSE